MATKPPTGPSQGELFAASPLACPDVANLPLIVDPHVASIEVMAPGSLYQPLLLRHQADAVDVGPGRLDLNEEAFVRDLIRRLYPAGNHPKSPKTPLRWGEREIWLKRNIEKRDDSFRLRVDDSDWFYPDFVVWILDYQARVQTFGFVDPKGLGIGVAGGWYDYKMVATLYMPHVVERSLAATSQTVAYRGEPWTFRVRGVIVSTSSLDSLKDQPKFRVRDETGKSVPACEADFRRGRILFPHGGTDYIDEVLSLLTQDREMDPILALAAEVLDDAGYFTPVGELQHELVLRKDERDQPDCEYIGALLGDYLRPNAAGEFGTWAVKERRGQLLEHARDGLLGLGGEKAAAIRDHPTPCEELFRRLAQARR